MDEALTEFLAHPLRAAPYTMIRFAKHNQHRVPIFAVGDKEAGRAEKAMRAAHNNYGSSCFYCGRPMTADSPSDLFTRDHVQAASLGGTDDLHNLVFCCRPCNEDKGILSIAVYHPRRSADYIQAMDRHIVRSLAALTRRDDANADAPVNVQTAR